MVSAVWVILVSLVDNINMQRYYIFFNYSSFCFLYLFSQDEFRDVFHMLRVREHVDGLDASHRVAFC